MSRSLFLVFASFLTVSVAAACASHETGDGGSPPSLGPGDCAHVCAPDGLRIVDCREEVVATCGAGTTCSNATCVSGCEAAAKEQSSVGCEYFAAKPSAFTENPGYFDVNCYAVMIANTWSAPVELNVEYDGKAIASSYFRIPRGRGRDIRYELLPDERLPAGELAILFLAMQKNPLVGFPPIGFDYAPCPATVGAAIVGDVGVRGSGIGKMFHIRSSAPVIAYDMYPYGGASSYIPSSSLLLPTSAWGTESLAMGGYATTNSQQIGQGFLSYFQVLAREDDTRVKIKPTMTLSSAAGRPQIGPGQTGEFALGRGELLQFTQIEEPNGTAVESDKPVSLVGGSTCMLIPNEFGHCDTLHQHLPPIRLLGDTYVATRYRDRAAAEPERTPWRILAAANGTKLTYDPPMDGAPVTLDRGQWKEFWGPGPFVVKSQDRDHPIYVAAYMTGAATVSTGEGDPEMVNVVPVGQYLSSYLFLTDPTYGNTNLVFVRGATDGRYDDVELDCGGTVEGWKKIGSTRYEVAYVDLVRKGVAEGSCDNGVHRASSKSPFALTVWGWDRAASYGFPAGMGTRTLNDAPAIR